MDCDDLSDLTDLSSELSSPPRSVSPPPTAHYPSPESSQDSACTSGSEQSARKHGRENEELPPAKKRKSYEAKPRKTVYLELPSPSAPPAAEQSSQLDLLLKVLRKRRKIVVIAGAGISTSAGVPDFRSSHGLFNTLRSDNKLKASGKHLFDASVYQTDSSTSSFHDMVRTLSKMVSTAKPTEFHHMLATLANEGRLMRLYTQNVDGIDTSLAPLKTSVPLSSKGPWPRTIQLHGSLETMVCSKCHTLSPFEAALFNGPSPPPCAACITNDEVRTNHAGKRSHGIGKLRPRMVLYNEHNPDEEAIGTVVTSDLRARPDAVIVVGTSMEIPGVKRIVRELCGVVRGRRDGLAVWINRGPPPIGKEFEDCWDLVVKGDCDQVAELAEMRRWNDVGVRVTDSEAEEAKHKDGELRVIVKSPTKNKSIEAGLLTPASSPRLGPTTTTAMSKPKLKLLFNPSKVPAGTEKLKKSKMTALSSTNPTKAKANAKAPKHNATNLKPASSSIKTTFKITKSRPRSPSTHKPSKKSPPTTATTIITTSPTAITKEPPFHLFDPISASSARSNTATAPTRQTQPFFPNLSHPIEDGNWKKETQVQTVSVQRAKTDGVVGVRVASGTDGSGGGSPGRLSEMRDTIVSPRGRLKEEMRVLLN